MHGSNRNFPHYRYNYRYMGRKANVVYGTRFDFQSRPWIYLTISNQIKP